MRFSSEPLGRWVLKRRGRGGLAENAEASSNLSVFCETSAISAFQKSSHQESLNLSLKRTP